MTDIINELADMVEEHTGPAVALENRQRSPGGPWSLKHRAWPSAKRVGFAGTSGARPSS